MRGEALLAGGGDLVLALLPCWPLLAACLLALTGRGQRAAAALFLAGTGLAVTILLTPFLPGQDALSGVVRVLAAGMPLLLWRREAAERLSGVVVFLTAFCVMLSVGLRAMLPVVALLALASVLPALHEAAGAPRARQAWEKARLRVMGAVLALLGAALAVSPGEVGTTGRAGMLLLAVGLCLLAGLGQAAFEAPGVDRGLDGLPRLGALALMLRLPPHEVIHLVFLVAGLVALALAVLRRESGTAALVTLCAAVGVTGHGVLAAALLFLTLGVVLECGRISEGERRWMAAAVPPSPAFPAAALLVGPLLEMDRLAGGVVLLMVVAQAARLRPAWVERAGPAFWLLAALGVGAAVTLACGAPGSWPWSGGLAWRAA